jgi:GNAT superfamily N-acetyltransferase
MFPRMQSNSAVSSPRTDDGAPLSLRWLGIDFRALLPWTFRSLTVEHGTVDELLPFVTNHHANLFGAADDQRWRSETLDGNKLRFIEDSDIFLIRAEGRTVGALVGHPSDSSTYYVRSMALLPEYRGRGTYPQLMQHLASVLRAAGVERLEGDTSPANWNSIITCARLGFVATGTLNSDRWGALVRVTWFLNVEAEDVFHNQYCAGTWPRRRLTNTTGPERRPG